MTETFPVANPPWCAGCGHVGGLSALAAVIGCISVGGIFLTSFAGLLRGFAPFVALRVWTLATSVLLYRDN